MFFSIFAAVLSCFEGFSRKQIMLSECENNVQLCFNLPAVHFAIVVTLLLQTVQLVPLALIVYH